MAMAGLVVLLLTGVATAWLLGLWGWEKRPPPVQPRKNLASGPRPDPEPSAELAFPVAQKEQEEKIIRQIYVGVGNGWHLIVHSDGTARLGYGAADGWAVKPNTFDFAATLKALRTVARKHGFAGGRHYHVSFRAEGKDPPIQGYTQNGPLVLGLLDKAVDGLQNRNDRFDELWKAEPPFRIEGK
jgi:hypothetical protein